MKKAYNILFVTLQIIIMCAFFLPISLLKFRLPETFNYGAYTFIVFGMLCVVIALYQLRHQLSPFPSPRKNSSLIDTGIFKYSRHPIYFGLLLIFFSLSLILRDVYHILIALMFYLFFCWKSTFEENLLMARFPKYKDYRKKTPRI